MNCVGVFISAGMCEERIEQRLPEMWLGEQVRALALSQDFISQWKSFLSITSGTGVFSCCSCRTSAALGMALAVEAESEQVLKIFVGS